MAHVLKINFQGNTRDIGLFNPVTVARLREDVALMFQPEDEPNVTGRLSFTYCDSDGSQVRINTDSELELALRLCDDYLSLTASLLGVKKEVRTVESGVSIMAVSDSLASCSSEILKGRADLYLTAVW